MFYRSWIAALFSLATPLVSAVETSRVMLNAYPVEVMESLPNGSTLDRVRLRGMLALPTVNVDGMRMSQLSALAWDDDEQLLYALSDKGYLFHLKPEFRNDTLVNVTLQSAVKLADAETGKRLQSADSEGMDILNGRNGRKGDAELIVSFERTPRVIRYRPDGKALGHLPLPAAIADAKAYRSANRALESVCVDPVLGVLTTPEEPLNDDNQGTRIFSLSGKTWRYSNSFGITAMECLGDGRVIILERAFGVMRRTITLKLVRLPETPTKGGITAEPIMTLDAGAGHRVDNFEGLTRHQGKRYFMISDDNDLFVQQTLLLYFEFLD